MKPNILFICCDQQRWDCVGFNRRYPVRTPNLDRLAAEGMCFDNSYTPIPVCAPARQAMICGRRPERFGALWNYDQGIPASSLPAEAFSWVRELQRAGYRNAHVGSWEISPTLPPFDFGYERYVPASELLGVQRNQYPDRSFRKGVFGEVSPYPVEVSPTHQNAKRVMELIDEFGDDPWHIKMDFMEPHPPCRPCEPFASQYEAKDVPKWGAFDDPLKNKPYIQRQMRSSWNTEEMSWEDFHETARLYYGVISQIDDAIGRVIRHLEKKGLSENTVVIYTSDHGDMCGERRMIDKHYIMYDSVVHVPLVIRYPWMVKPGGRCGAMVTNMLDLVPTILELAGLPVPENIDGVSLMPYLRGERTDSIRRYALSTYNGQQFGLFTQRMIRNERYKYVWNPCDVDELYDLEKDPLELDNLAVKEESGALLGALRLDLLRELEAVEDYTAKSPWLRNQLLRNKKCI